MIAGMGMLAILCLALGIFPGMVVSVISPAVFSYTGADSILAGRGFLHIPETLSDISPAAFLISIVIMFITTLIFVFVTAGRRKISYGDSWDCGTKALTPRMQYTATGFTKPLRMIFRKIYLPKRDLRISYIVKPFFLRSIKYSGEITPFFELYIYRPFTSLIRGAARKVSILQSGSLHLYLGYILATLILLLIFGGN